MPLHGAYTLSDWSEKILISCEACGLRRQYDRDAMIKRLGPEKVMTDLRLELALAEGCEKQGKNRSGLYDRCRVKYDETPERRKPAASGRTRRA